jgi:hypothetical protein
MEEAINKLMDDGFEEEHPGQRHPETEDECPALFDLASPELGSNAVSRGLLGMIVCSEGKNWTSGKVVMLVVPVESNRHQFDKKINSLSTSLDCISDLQHVHILILKELRKENCATLSSFAFPFTST